MRNAAAELSKNRALLAYGTLVFLHVALVWLLPHFPTQDGPSHIYNLVILRDLLNGGKEWGRYFTCDLRAVPNLGFHLVSYPLSGIFSPYAVERIFVSVYILLMTLSVPVFLRAFGSRALPLSFLTFPVLFTFPLMMGFYSFVIAVPCMLLAIAAAWRLRTAPPVRRLIAINLAGFALFFLHLIPFIIYLLFLCIMIANESFGRKRPHRELFGLLAAISPSFLLCAFYLWTSRGGSPAPASYTLSLYRFYELLASLLMFSTDTFSKWQLGPWALLSISLYILVKTMRKEPMEPAVPRDSRRVLIAFALSLLLIYFALPVDFGGGDFFNQRLPWILFIICLPVVGYPSSGFFSKRGKWIFPALALLFLAVNSVILDRQSERIDEFLAGMRVPIPEGSYIAAIKPDMGEWSRVEPLLHAASYYGIEKKCIDAGNYEAASGVSFVHFRDDAPLLPRQDYIAFFPDRIDWGRYPAVRYLLAWEIDDMRISGLMNHFSLLMKERSFSLWQRKPLS